MNFVFWISSESLGAWLRESYVNPCWKRVQQIGDVRDWIHFTVIKQHQVVAIVACRIVCLSFHGFCEKASANCWQSWEKLACITGVIVSRLSGERRQVRSEREALDSRDGEGAKKIRASKKGILRWCVIWRFLKPASLLLKFVLSLPCLFESGWSNKRGQPNFYDKCFFCR